MAQQQGRFTRAFDNNGIPVFVLKWSCEDVADWVTNTLELPQYESCFTSNFINGNKLIHMHSSNLPSIGITDFEHIKKITKAVRQQLGIPQEKWDRSISLPPTDTKEHFLQRKSFVGAESRSLTYEQHVRYLEEFKKHGVSEYSS